MAESRQATEPHNCPMASPSPGNKRDLCSLSTALGLLPGHSTSLTALPGKPELRRKRSPDNLAAKARNGARGPGRLSASAFRASLPSQKQHGGPYVQGQEDPATHHMGCHLPVFAELFWLHKLLRHSLPSLRKSKSPPRKTAMNAGLGQPPFLRGQLPPPGHLSLLLWEKTYLLTLRG